MTMVSATFDTVDSVISQNDQQDIPSTSHGKLEHKKGAVKKSDKGVNTTSELHEPLLKNKNNSKSSKILFSQCWPNVELSHSLQYEAIFWKVPFFLPLE